MIIVCIVDRLNRARSLNRKGISFAVSRYPITRKLSFMDHILSLSGRGMITKWCTINDPNEFSGYKNCLHLTCNIILINAPVPTLIDRSDATLSILVRAEGMHVTDANTSSSAKDDNCQLVSTDVG